MASKTKPPKRPRQRFSIIPPGVIWDVRDGHLTDLDLRLAGVIGTMTNKYGWVSDVAQARIAHLVGCRREQVSRSIKRLEARGHISKIDPGRPDGRKSYQLIFDRSVTGEGDALSRFAELARELAAAGSLPDGVVAMAQEAVERAGVGATDGPVEAAGCASGRTGQEGVRSNAQGGVRELAHTGCDPSAHTIRSSSDNSSPTPSSTLDPTADGRTGQAHASPGDGALSRAEPSPEDEAWWREARQTLKGEFGPAVFARCLARLRLGADRVLTACSAANLNEVVEVAGPRLKALGARALWSEEGDRVEL